MASVHALLYGADSTQGPQRSHIADDILEEFGVTPLGLVIKNNDRYSVSQHLEMGASPNDPVDKLGTSPVGYAINKASWDALSVLLATEGIDLDARASMGLTALQMAVYKNNSDLITVLLAAGANPEASWVQPLNLTALDIAKFILDSENPIIKMLESASEKRNLSSEMMITSSATT